MFEIDEMARLIAAAEEITGYHLGQDDDSDLALRVLAEHARTMTFLISDGVFPSNEDRGYVLRRIMRRAIRFAYLLGVQDLVAGRLVDTVVEIMGDDYPQLVTTHDLIRSVVEREEIQFRKTLASGSAILDEQLSKLEPGAELPGSVAFLLHDTYGFPFDVTAEVVAERGFSVDRDGFDADMAEQRTRAKEARKGVVQAADFEQVQALVEEHGQTDFVGRDELIDVAATVLLVTGLGTDTVSVFTDRTPFYAESGGQIGDTGTITTETGTATVIDTVYAVPGVHRHVIDRIDGEILAGQQAEDLDRRRASQRHPPEPHRHPPAALGARARCWAITSSSRARWSAPIGCGSTSATSIRSPRTRSRQIEDLVNQRDPDQPGHRTSRGHQGRGRADGGHRVLRRQVRRHGPGAARPVPHWSSVAVPMSPRSATSV